MAGIEPFKAVLFDFGDTLFYSPSGAAVMVDVGVDRATAEALWEEIWLASKTPEELATQRDRSPEAHRAGWTALFARADTHAPRLSQLLYDRVMDPINWIPYPDVPDTLRGLKEWRIRVGVLSNITTHLRPVFAKHGLDRLVDAYVHSFEHGLEKPDPELFLTACTQLDVAPAQALMVGDSHLTDGGAVGAGLSVLLLPPVAPGAVRGLERVLQLARTESADPLRDRPAGCSERQ